MSRWKGYDNNKGVAMLILGIILLVIITIYFIVLAVLAWHDANAIPDGMRDDDWIDKDLK